MSDNVGEDDRSPIEQALMVVLYAPLGLALTARDELPSLVAKGQRTVGAQVTLARMIGQFAVVQGQREAEKAMAGLAGRAGAVASRLGGFPGAPGPRVTDAGPRPAGAAASPAIPSPAPAAHDVPASRPDVAAQTPVLDPWPPIAPEAPGDNGTSVPSSWPGAAQALAIPGYESLSASQVVQRLAGLANPELEAVRFYEEGHRGRRTILSKVAQLQSERS